MTLALVSSSNGIGAPPLRRDLETSGYNTVQTSGCSSFVQDVIKKEADLVVCFELIPDASFFDSIASLGRLAPRPVVVFTSDSDAEKIALATQSFIHAYVVNGYSLSRLRSVLHLAQARFRQDQVIRNQLAEVSQRFSERKLVDRAKGILMGARQLREEEAFSALRSAAMASKQRIGQLSQTVINSALFAEAMNRAGQLRMLSQRLVKLYALSCAGVLLQETGALFKASIGQVDNNLKMLNRSLSKPTLGDLIDQVSESWARLKSFLLATPAIERLYEVDRLAEEVLQQAERLTTNLEEAAYASALRVINVAGRQRMLSQRLAKKALLKSLIQGNTAADSISSGSLAKSEFTRGFTYLNSLPMSNDKITLELERAMRVWKSFETALDDCFTEAGRTTVAKLSEELLGYFDRLTDEFERAMQTLVG